MSGVGSKSVQKCLYGWIDHNNYMNIMYVRDKSDSKNYFNNKVCYVRILKDILG